MTKKWLETRRSYLNKLKSQVRLIAGEPSQEILTYSLSNQELYTKVWETSSQDHFVKEALKSNLVLCGDFHSSPAIKRFYKKLLMEVASQTKRPKVLALECFEQRHQEDLELWLRGVLQEDAFLKRVRWQETWGFSWESYKKLILSLKTVGYEFLCINHFSENLKERDYFISGCLHDFLSARPESLVFCMIGQHHLGPENLPNSFKTRSGQKEFLVLHLDPEELYFTLGEYGLLEEVNVVRLKQNFAFIATPPWVHWQSHLLFLDEFLEEDDEYEYEDDKGRDYEQVVYDYTKLICRDLGVSQQIKPVEVAFIDEYQIAGEVKPELYDIMQPLLDSESSFYWPEQYEGIMVVNSLNHAATVAGKYLHAQMMGVQKLPWGDIKAFKEWSWLEAMGYFLSKLINPKRSPANVQNLSAFLRARLGVESSKKIMKVLLSTSLTHADGEDKSLVFEPQSWQELAYASRLMGSLVGEALFKLYLEGGLSHQTLRTYMSVPVTDKVCFEPFYKLVIDKLYLK